MTNKIHFTCNILVTSPLHQFRNYMELYERLEHKRIGHAVHISL